MEAFNKLVELAEKLNGPDGCPWDKRQNFLSLQPYLLEEVHEVLDAIDSNEDEKVIEELGDLFYIIIFYGKIAEREQRFHLSDILENVYEKLVRRHPHVFGELRCHTADEVLKQWEKNKRQEVTSAARSSLLDGMPATLPLLTKAQKMIKKMQRVDYPPFSNRTKQGASEEFIGDELLALLVRAEEAGIDAESALRRTLKRIGKEFRSWEKKDL